MYLKKNPKDTKEQSEAVNDFSSITPGGIWIAN